ncbi:DUF2357 domain-containing protein [Fervidicella metallireducens]|nr:DUF2357 domain-containing protein [Fervidicella metallireducens]
MQIKLVLNYKIFVNGKFIDTEIGENIVTINKELFPNGDLGEEIFSFSEYTRTEMKFFCSDIQAKVEIETYESEDMVTLIPQQEILLSPGGEKENMLVPGFYQILIQTSECTFKGFYKVLPSSMDWERLLNMRNYLEKTVKGLSYNIYIQRSGNHEKNFEHNIFFFELYKYLNKNADILLNNIRAIIDNPITDIFKEYKIKSYTKSNSSKSQRWLNSKGYKYNSNVYNPSMHYEKHSSISLDTRENKVIKKILDYFYKILLEILDNYNKIKKELLERRMNLNEQIKETERHFEKIKSIPSTKKAQKETELTIKRLNEESEEYFKNINIIDNYLNEINKIKNFIVQYKEETWLNEIDPNIVIKPTTRLMKNRHYNEVYEIYCKQEAMLAQGKVSNAFPVKNTSKLFEIYSCLLVKKILEEMDFQWTDGWLKNIDDIMAYNGDLVSGEKIILKKDKFTIELIYDNELNKIKDVKNTRISQVVSVNSKSRRPDIILNLYKENKYKGSAIVEVKYRKKHYIYNNHEDTDVIYQLRDYSSLRYYDGEKNKLDTTSSVGKIIVVYPKQNGACKFKDNVSDFAFVQIEATDLTKEKPYGYEEVKEEICEFLTMYDAI